MSRRRRRHFQPVNSTHPKPTLFNRASRFIPLILVILAYFNVAAGSLFYPLDYDLGWHLKYGQDVVVNHVISSNNTYSVEMPGYHWRNSSWLSDVLRYVLFYVFSFQGLMVAGVVTMVVTFFIFAKAARFSFWESALLFPIVVYMEFPLTSASFRAQLLSFTGIGLVMWIVSVYEQGYKRALVWLPPLFLVWANIHGGFFLGLVYFVAWSFLWIMQKVYLANSERLSEALKRHGVPFTMAILASVAFTLVNPWGTELYLEHVLVDIGTRFTKENPEQFLVEWKPLFTNTNLLLNHTVFGLFLLAGIFSLVWKKNIAKYLPIALPVIILYLSSFYTRRFAWTTYFLALPLLGAAVSSVRPRQWYLLYGIPLTVSLIFFGYVWHANLHNFMFFKTDWRVYCSLTGCSPESADYLVQNNLYNLSMYTTYDWGGWLIWNYPLIKPLVDGRMSTWIDDKGYSPFMSYVTYENNWKDINDSEYEVVYLSPGKRHIFNRMLDLVKENKWKIAYRDNNAFVFVRNK